MLKIKRHYYRRAKEMSDSTINIVQNICNSASLECISSISSSNISLCNSVNSISNNFLLKQNIHNNNYQLNLDNLEQIYTILIILKKVTMF